MYDKILVPMALDHGVSAKTLEIAQTLSNTLSDGQARITALHVYETPPGVGKATFDETLQQEALTRTKAALIERTQHIEGITVQMVIGHTSRSIIEYANEHAIDCIVMGSHKPGLSDYLLGSTAARVVRHAPCAVHVYRGA